MARQKQVPVLVLVAVNGCLKIGSMTRTGTDRRQTSCRRRRALGFAILCLPLAAACLGGEADWSLAPLLSISENPVGDSREIRALGPIVAFDSYREKGGKETQAFHPLFFHLSTADRSETQSFPLFYRERIRDDRRQWFFPLFFEHKFGEKNGGYTEGFVVLFLIYGGHHRREGNYFVFLPLGGNTKGLMGKDEMRFVLFPLYFDTRLGENRAYHILFPFIGFSHGGGKQSFQFWPLYGYSKVEGKYASRFFLWPLFTYSADETSKGVSSLPLFGYRTGKDDTRVDVAWPFFGYRRHKETREWRFPYPLFVAEKSPDTTKLYLFPLFGWRRDKRSNAKRMFVLYPLFRYSGIGHEDGEEQELSLALVYNRYSRTYADGSESDYLIAWPLMSRTEGRDGETSFRALEVIWFRDPTGWQRNFSPLFYLAEDDRNATASRTRLLWGMFSQTSAPRKKSLDFGLLFNYASAEGAEDVRLLGGLFGWGKSEGRGYVRLMFLKL